MGETDWGGHWVFFWLSGPYSINLESNFLLMGAAVFPPCCLTRGQAMVEVMKIMVTCFQRFHAHTLALSTPNLAAGLHWPTPPSETPEHSWASLSHSLVGHCSFLLGPGGHKVLSVPPKSLFPQSWVSSGSSMVGLMATFSKRAYAIPRSTALRAPAPASFHCWPTPPQETLTHRSGSVSVESLDPGVHKACLSPLSVSGRYEV